VRPSASAVAERRDSVVTEQDEDQKMYNELRKQEQRRKLKEVSPDDRQKRSVFSVF
jgi:hypothetical protein